jgi:protein-S-isoprenylcysteine O-methyltransferase Ste14
MQSLHLAALLVALTTWTVFAITMRTYFRFARQKNAAKTWLTLSAYVCTGVQLVVLGVSSAPEAPWLWAGIIGYVAALVLFWSALAAHGKAHPAFAFLNVAPESLTTAGPYRLIRHPIYSSYLLAWCSGVVVAAQPWLLLTVVCMAIFYLRAASQEEKTILGSALGTPYRDYRLRTGMFLPNLVRLAVGS